MPAGPQGLAFQEFGDQIWRAFEGPELVDGKNARVVQRCGSLGFLFEAADTFGILRDKGGQYLDCHFALEHTIPGTVNLAHTARAQRPENLVAVQPCARGKRHSVRIIAEWQDRSHGFERETQGLADEDTAKGDNRRRGTH